ncbi:hypothetical protein OAK47_00110 [Planctomycetaceae bacterium]|nr:hypothetical protein [Planctomycetaceae bacterium]MDC0261600.1 hypothetical protein [Planctomycetaceae bacterium]
MNCHRFVDAVENPGTQSEFTKNGCGDDGQTGSHRVRSGNNDPRFESYDRLISEFMKKHCVPGLSIAVTNQGKIAFSRGYG